MNPLAHGPLHDESFSPLTLPYRPAAHGPLQVALGSAAAAPYCPMGHAWQTTDPATL